MNNNDILIRLRYALDIKDIDMIEIFKLGGISVTREELQRMLLKSKNNRLIWGGMTALSKIAPLRPGEIFENIAAVIEAYENGSVITRDNSITVFAELAKADKEYEKVLFRKLMKHLETCRSKEVGQHAERIAVCINKQNAQEFISVLLKRRESLTEAQKKRVDKLIKNISVDNFTSN
jgi:hypothetical protein